MRDYKIKDHNFEAFLELHQQNVRKNVIEQYIKARKQKKLTQEDIADTLRIKRPNITRFENGSYNPTLDMLVKIAECMDMELEIHLVEKM